MQKDSLKKVIAGIIAALFFYAAVSKLIDIDLSRQEMRNQIFPKAIADILLWVIPIMELSLVFLLLYLRTRLKAFYASAILLTLFTLYIAVTMTGIFGRIPCSCGGILKHMHYSSHLIFNLFFICLALWGIALEKGWSINKRWSHLKKERSLQAIE